MMRKAEVLMICLVLCGVLFRLFHLPGAAMLIVIIGSLLVLFYALLSFALFQDVRLGGLFSRTSYGSVNAITTIVAIIAGWNCGMAVLGLIFKIMFWPGGSTMLISGIIGLLVSSILLIAFTKKEDIVRKRGMRHAVVTGILALVFYLTPSTTFADIIYRNHHPYRDALKAVLINPEDVDAQEKLQALRDDMNGDPRHNPEKER